MTTEITNVRAALDAYGYTPITDDPAHPLHAAYAAYAAAAKERDAARAALDAAPIDTDLRPFFDALNRLQSVCDRANAAYTAAFADAALTRTAALYVAAFSAMLDAYAEHARNPTAANWDAYADAARTHADAAILYAESQREFTLTHVRQR